MPPPAESVRFGQFVFHIGRGELRRGLPVGLVWGEADGDIRWHPDEAVTGVIDQTDLFALMTRGLEAADAGDFGQAAEHFMQAATMDPGFAAAERFDENRPAARRHALVDRELEGLGEQRRTHLVPLRHAVEGAGIFGQQDVVGNGDLGRRRLEVTPQLPPYEHRIAGRSIRLGDGSVDVVATRSSTTLTASERPTMRVRPTSSSRASRSARTPRSRTPTSPARARSPSAPRSWSSSAPVIHAEPSATEGSRR